MSIEPEPMACNIGGPEVKSDQCALNGSLLISPAAVSRASEPAPAWSPMFSVTLDTLTWLADVVPLGPGSLADEELADEHAVGPPSSSKPAATAPAPIRRPLRPPPGLLPGWVMATFLIS